MNLDDQNLDNLFKDTLEDKSAPFDKAAWEKVAPVLKKRKMKKGGFWIGGISLLVLLLLFSFQSYLFDGKGDHSSNDTAQSELNPIKNKLKNEHSSTKASNNEETKPTENKNEENNANLSTVNTENTAGLDKGEESSPKVIVDNQINTSSSKPKTTSIVRKNNTKLNSNVANDLASTLNKNAVKIKKVQPILLDSITNDENNLIVKTKRSKNFQLLSTTKRSSPITFSFLKRTPTLLSSFFKDSFSKANLTSLAKIDLPIDPDFKKSISWSFGLYSGTGHIVNNNLNEIKQNTYTLNLKGVRSQLAGINLKAEYGRLGLTLGLEHQKYLFQESLEQRQETITIDTTYRVISKNKVVNGENYWVIDESFDTSRSTSFKQRLNKEETSVSYLQVPIELSYRLQVLRKLSIMPSIGARINIPVSISGFRVNNNALESASVNSLSPNMNLFAGLSVAYQVHPRWLFGFQNRYIHQERLSNSLNQGLNKGSIVNALTLNYLLF